MPLMTTDEIAAWLQLQPETIREMARTGRIPAIKLGRVWRFNRDAIGSWIEQQTLIQTDEEQKG